MRLLLITYHFFVKLDDLVLRARHDLPTIRKEGYGSDPASVANYLKMLLAILISLLASLCRPAQS